MDVELLSLSPDPVDAWAKEGADLGIRTSLLSDSGNQVAEAYGVMRWQMASGEPVTPSSWLTSRDGWRGSGTTGPPRTAVSCT